MKMNHLAFLAATVLSLSCSGAKASAPNWKACAKEIGEHGCGGADQQIWECLQKSGAPLSQLCGVEQAKADELFENQDDD